MRKRQPVSTTELLHWNGAGNDITVVFAHGAGAGSDSHFMQQVAAYLAGHGLAVVRFDFPYWRQVRASGRKRPPDAQPLLRQAMLNVAQQCQGKPLWLAGKSMGARIAFQCADAAGAVGAVALGFPFHPPAKPERNRLADLNNNCGRNLIVQGTRDAFGKPAWVEQHKLPDNIQLDWVEHADHHLTPAKKSGIGQLECWQQIAASVARFVKEHT